MVNGKERFDYHFEDWWPIIQKQDLIPVLGLALSLERTRKTAGISPAQMYLPGLFIGKEQAVKELISLGTASWPKSTTKVAHLRSYLMAARNVGFAGYHGLALTEVLIRGPQVVRAISSILQG